MPFPFPLFQYGSIGPKDNRPPSATIGSSKSG